MGKEEFYLERAGMIMNIYYLGKVIFSEKISPLLSPYQQGKPLINYGNSIVDDFIKGKREL